MADQVCTLDHYSVSIPHKVGEGARVLGALRDAGVNFIAVWGYGSGGGKAQLELVPEDSAAFAAAAKRAKLKVKKSTVLHIQGDDRPGAAAEILSQLAAAKINVGALQAVCAGAGRFGAVLYLPAAATRKAAKVLGAA